MRDWQLTGAGGMDEKAIAVMAVAAAAGILWTWFSLDPSLRIRVRLSLCLLRAFALVAAVSLLVQPTLRRRVLAPAPSSFAVVVDTSHSMRRGGDQSRLADARRLLEEAKDTLAAIGARHRLRWFAFADRIVPIDGPGDLSTPTLPGDATKTRLALEELVNGGEARPVGALLISDGADTTPDMHARGMEDLAWATALDIPINTLATERAARRKDMSISLAKMDPFAFSRSETPVAVTVESVGYSDSSTEVTLWQSGAMIRKEKVALVGGEGRITFTVRPSQLGRQVLSVSIPVPKGDEIPQNNTAHVGFEVIRDKLRVLHLAGHPSWDQRFLREVLSSWPRVDLVSFYVLRTPFQSQTLGAAGLALIPFPTKDLFENHLDEFDVVIIQDLEPAEVDLDHYLDGIAQFVQKGGAVVLLGAQKSFGRSAMSSGAFAHVLPVTLPPPDTQQGRAADETPFSLRLTAAGERHPVTRLDESAAATGERWKAATRLDGMMLVAGVPQGAVVLAEHPSLTVGGAPAPLIAVREAGRGRSMAVTTDSLWRLRFTGPMTGGRADTFDGFWHRALAWLTRDPELSRLRVSTSPANVPPREAATIDVELLDEAYQPVPGATVACEITWLDDAGMEARDTRELRLDDAGRYRLEWTPRGFGPHRIRVSTGDGAETTDRFLALSSDVETENLAPNKAFLELLAAATDGLHLDATKRIEELATREASGEEVVSREDLSLWDHPVTLALLLGLLLSEWLLRRRLGLN